MKTKKRKKTVDKKIKKEKEIKENILSDSSKRGIAMVLMTIFALLIFLSFLGKAGQGGQLIFDFFEFLVGKVIYILPFLLFFGAILFLKSKKKHVFLPIFGSIILFVVSSSSLLEIITKEAHGGMSGYYLSLPFLKYFGIWVSGVLFFGLAVISLVILFDLKPKKEKKESKIIEEEKKEVKEKKEIKPAIIGKPQFEIKKINTKKKKEKETKGEIVEKKKTETNILDEMKGEYIAPPVNYLSHSNQKPLVLDIDSSSEIIKKTLLNFGISVEMKDINIGPSVTQYSLKPAEGVKLSKITGLVNDLSLSLAAHPIRIEAPIPGKSLVGVEVPNKERAIVTLRELFEEEEFKTSLDALCFPLGKDVGGDSIFSNIESMPHLLVAGSTGSGKTIFLQTLIVSLIFRNSPKSLRLILVDPKRVEFPIYSTLPHLLTPIIYDAQKTVNALNWLVVEMERRFEVLRSAGFRDIGSFNKAMTKDEKMKDEFGIMPYIVVVIDELADLMMAKGREIESTIVRLAQLARAVGIHLVLATQRPSVDVITGLIKANLPCRVAFNVASQFDSRTVLDTSGAEHLLGKGDLLFLSSDYAKPKRIQGCFIIQKEVTKIVEYISEKNTYQEESEIADSLNEELEKSEQNSILPEADDGLGDTMYEDAKRVVIEHQKASASLLQRRLKVGYARAARLIDMLEDHGVVGPQVGSKPREVYVDDGESIQ